MKVFLTLLLHLTVLTWACAQTGPSLVLIAKLDGYNQVSATQMQAGTAFFGVQVGFNGSVLAGATVQLRSPNGTVTALQRQPDDSFSLERTFESRAALDEAFRDGDYSIIYGGITVPVSVVTTPSIAPVLISNFDTLQASPVDDPVVTWPRIPGAGGNDLLSIEVTRSDGTVVFSNDSALPATGTSFGLPHLPTDAALSVELVYMSPSFLATNGRTNVFIGRGFIIKAPLRVVLAPPTITTAPASIVMEVGGPVYLSVIASGQALQYQWLRNGQSLVGETAQTLARVTVQATDAGRYAVRVSNPGGSVVSEPAVVAVSPVLRVSTLAGGPRIEGSADGPLAAARFSGPSGIAVDAEGNIWVADEGNATVRRVGRDAAVSTIAGVAGQLGWADGLGATARFRRPHGLAISRDGSIFVSDAADHVIRKITVAGLVTTYAGVAGQAGYVNGAGGGARFREPSGLAADGAGNLYVSDTGNFVVRKISESGVVSTLAGRNGVAGYIDGLGDAARFKYPAGLAVDPAGNVVVADTSNQAIRRITPTGLVSTLAVGDVLAAPLAVAVDSSGSVYMSNLNRIFRITPDGWAVRVAGSTQFVGHQDGQGFTASFYSPAGLAFDRTGALLVSDTADNVLRRAELLPTEGDPLITMETPPSAAVTERGGTVVFYAQASGPSVAYQWFRDGSPIAGATRASLVVRNASESNVASFSVLVGNAAGYHKAPPVSFSLTSSANASRIVNLAIRSSVGWDAQSLIVGFATKATSPGLSVPMPILIRAVGPGLNAFGVSNAVEALQLAVFRSSEQIGFNENWVTGDPRLADYFSSVGAFALRRDSRDAALYLPLPSGTYSARVSNGGTDSAAVALAEIYDATPAGGVAAARLINVSARTQVGTGGNVLIAGFVVAGSASKTVLIRAVGPGLRTFGVPGFLANPRLDVFSGQTRVAANDNWEWDSDIVDLSLLVGAFGLSQFSPDSVLLVTLPPGAYSAQVSGVDNTTGVALVEIYEVAN